MEGEESFSIHIADFFYSEQFQHLSKHQKIGIFGQYVARQYLVEKGHEIVAENYYVRGGELDIVTVRGGRVHVVEVKTRTKEIVNEAQTAVHYFKQMYLRRSAEQFMSDKGWLYKIPWQIDVLAVIIDKNDLKVRIRMYSNVITDNK